MSDVKFKPLHCAMSVSNLEDSIKWFEDILGFKFRYKTPEFTPMGFKVAFLDNGGGFEIELFENRETKPVPEERWIPDNDSKTQGTKHIAFEVEDLDALLVYFKSKNIDIVMGPKLVFGLYVAFIHGPDKILIEFIQLNKEKAE